MGKVKILSTLQNKAAQKKSIHKNSSTVFLGIVNPEKGIDTEVSLLNHFLVKRNISDVIATIEYRDLSGKIYDSFNIKMNEPRSYAFRLGNHIKKEFIGSIYLYFQSNENLAVPFCAVMSVIKTKESVCGVHTYGRRLEKNEMGTAIELHKTIETGWTLRDSESIRSFAALHGGQFKLSLDIKIECSNESGIIKTAKIYRILEPFGTLIIFPQDIIEGLIEHLGQAKGHAKIFINGLSGIFPRMICGNYKPESKNSDDLTKINEIQFTHTNFDFSQISQPNAISNYGYYNQPDLPDGYGIVYPVQTKSDITIGKSKYIPDTLHQFKVKPMQQLEVHSKNINLPSRFIAAAVGIWGKENLESECSTGTYIEDYLKISSHWHWGLLKPGFEKGNSSVSIIYNKFNQNQNLKRKLKFFIYSEDCLLLEEEIILTESQIIKAMDFLPKKLPNKSLWYVLIGDILEDLNVFSTFYPADKAGFAEHAF